MAMASIWRASAVCLLAALTQFPTAHAAGVKVVDEGEATLAYLSEAGVNELVAVFPPPPAPGSEKDRYDMQEVLMWQTGRSDEQCAEALNQESTLLTQFFSGKAYPFEGKPPEVLAFFRRAGSDARLVCRRLKNRFKRPRPRAPGMVYCALKVGNKYSYPCRYAATAFLFAEMLSQLSPNKRTAYLAAATKAGQYRIIAGINRRSDMDAGKELAAQLYLELSKNENFRKDLESLRKYLKRNKKKQ